MERIRTVLATAAFGLIALPGWAQDPVAVRTIELVPVAAPADTYFGTVRARDIFSLSYGARGCIVDVAEDAKAERLVRAGQVLVRLDDARSLLGLRTAEARVAALEAALDERRLSVDAAVADERRRGQDLALVQEEFQRSSEMLGRGLINESAMDAIERSFLESTFAAERAQESIATAKAAARRAEIALEIGRLEVATAQVDHEKLLLMAPFDGVLVGFDANSGDCIAEGALAGRIYVPEQKSVDVFFRISRLTEEGGGGVSVGAEVQVTRVNGAACGGTITRIDTEADLETQFVEATVDVDPTCAPNLFLNESVEVEAVSNDPVYSLPFTAIDNGMVYVVGDTNRLRGVAVDVVSTSGSNVLVRLEDVNAQRVVAETFAEIADGLVVVEAE